MAPPTEGLTRLLDPVDFETFMSMFWERATLYIPGRPSKFDNLFNLDRFFRAVTPVADPAGNLVYLKAGSESADGRHYEMVINAEQIRPLLGGGWTIQAEHLETSDPGLAALARSLRERIRIASGVDVAGFLSPDRGGYGFHYDAAASWIVQIAGAKRWWYSSKPVIPFPQSNSTPSERAQWLAGLASADLQEQLLRAGDVLYLPGGCWHRVQAEGQSLHLDLTVRQSNYLQLLFDTLAPLLHSLPDWRHLPASRAAPGDLEQMDETLKGVLAERLGELRAAVEALAPADLYETWRDRVQSS